MHIGKNKISLFVVFALAIYFVSYPFLNGWPNPFVYDTFGYYLYLPMAFIHQDLGMQDFSVIENLRQEQFISPTLYQIHEAETGSWIIRYPSGLSVLLSPFYIIGHWIAKWGGYSQNGFSLPYQIAIVSGCLFYITSSLFLLRKILLNWFSDKVVAFTIVIICLGTNFIHQATLNTAMPHTLLFFLYTLIILFTIKWHKNKSFLNSVLLGVVIGLATICRPIEIISLFIPLFWEVSNWNSFKEKISNIWKNHLRSLIIAVVSGILIVFIQMLYWKIYAGHFIYNSYQNPGEGLDLMFPHIFDVLFSFKKGWFIYTPIIMFAFVGFYFLKKEKPKYFWSFAVFIALNLYLVSSWTCWWYAQSFSQRALVQSYVVLAIVLAFFIQAFFKLSNIKKGVFGALILFFIGLNIFQLNQYNDGIINGDRMTFDAYKAVFGKSEFDKNSLEPLLSYNRDISFEDANKKYLFENKVCSNEDFEGRDLGDGVELNENNKLLRVGPESGEIYFNEWLKPYNEFTEKEFIWVSISFKALVSDSNSRTRIVMNIKRNKNGENYGYFAKDISKHKNFEINKWKNYTYYYLTPHIRNKKDIFQSYFWYGGGGDVLIDNIQISHFQEK
ncbi:hypothetical protein N9544_07160 [Flavobacteriales bacterium]|nr:hypothetical protein [Flavobacteriales bacterium]